MNNQNNPPKKKAVALLYDPNNQAPQVVAAGQGLLADKIIETAKESDVPLYKDTNLTETLLKLDIGDCIHRFFLFCLIM